MTVNLGLGGIFLSDYINKYKDENLKDLISSKSS